jgi:pimeloyl-ACP methyl ester carboxylesterase
VASMSFTHTTLFSGLTNRRQTVRRRLGLVVLGAVMVSATACGAVPPTDAASADAQPAPTSTPVSTSTTTSTTTSSTMAPATTTTVPAATMPLRPTSTRDEFVDVDGVRLHFRCTGSGETTVLLIAGFESGDDTWGSVEPDIAAHARVCSYARPGTGTSDPAGPTQTFTTQASQLGALLTEIGEPGPYVVVGHSFGGAAAVTFASRYPAQVTGVVLVDTSPANWPTELCAIADGDSDFAAIVSSTCGGWTDPTGNAEHVDVFASFAEVAGIDSLASLPLTIITAVDRHFPGSTPNEVAVLTAAWNHGQQRWSELSTRSQVIPVENTSHAIQIDQPHVVIDAVIELLP